MLLVMDRISLILIHLHGNKFKFCIKVRSVLYKLADFLHQNFVLNKVGRVYSFKDVHSTLFFVLSDISAIK